MKPSLSVIVLVYNEELNLGYCLESVAGLASEIFVIDSYSTDGTEQIAKRYGARFVQHTFKNQAEQFNWALDNLEIKSDWILRLDADEYLTPGLKQEIIEALPKTPPEISGFYMKRRVYFMGRWIRHGGYYPTWILRLWRKGQARLEDREMDEHTILLQGKASRLKNDFVDDNKKDLASWIAKHNDFSTREARERLRSTNYKLQTDLGGQAGRKRLIKQGIYLKLPLFWRALFYFLYRYIFRLGFLDGKEGLIFHFLQGGWHQFLIDAKIYEKLKANQ